MDVNGCIIAFSLRRPPAEPGGQNVSQRSERLERKGVRRACHVSQETADTGEIVGQRSREVKLNPDSLPAGEPAGRVEQSFIAMRRRFA